MRDLLEPCRLPYTPYLAYVPLANVHGTRGLGGTPGSATHGGRDSGAPFWSHANVIKRANTARQESRPPDS
jgi:hypothetical protein